MSSPSVSVVLPVYNGEDYLRTAIESVLNQTFEDFELVACDDASTDESPEILASYDDSRVRVLRNDRNQRLFPTLNRLIRASAAPLVRLWGQDDRMKSHCLEREQEFWKTHPDLGMTYCQRDAIDADGNTIRSAPPDDTPEVLTGSHVAQISFYHGSMPGNISSVTLSREALDDVGLFREDMEVSGDFEMWVRLSASYRTGFIDEPLIDLRSHTEQLSRRAGVRAKFIRENEEIYERLFERLPPSIRDHARRYNRWHRDVFYVHSMLRALSAGEWDAARDIYAVLDRWTNVPAAIARWLISGNGRWLKPKCRYHFPI
jgi:glycosyltransferase involved in cell wall biosynthesis